MNNRGKKNTFESVDIEMFEAAMWSNIRLIESTNRLESLNSVIPYWKRVYNFIKLPVKESITLLDSCFSPYSEPATVLVVSFLLLGQSRSAAPFCPSLLLLFKMGRGFVLRFGWMPVLHAGWCQSLLFCATVIVIDMDRVELKYKALTQ